jgi:hypothetical protein
VYGVINRLTFADPIDAAAVALFEEGLQRVRAAGAQAAHVVQTGEREAVLVIVSDSQERSDEITQTVGSPWMRERIVALLDGPTERRTGEIVASTLV